MAMNKKELARVAELEKQIREARALRFTDKASPDVTCPSSMDYAVGFTAHQSHYGIEVRGAWTSSVSHGFLSDAGKKLSGSQNPIRISSSPTLALRVLRNSVEKECAGKLAAIDAEIERLESGDAE